MQNELTEIRFTLPQMFGAHSGSAFRLADFPAWSATLEGEWVRLVGPSDIRYYPLCQIVFLRKRESDVSEQRPPQLQPSPPAEPSEVRDPRPQPGRPTKGRGPSKA